MKTILQCSLVLIAVAVFGTGCGTAKPIAHSVSILPKTSASMEVDLVAAKELELGDFKAYSMNKYWQPNDPMRKGADKYTIKISGGQANPSMLPVSDPIWQSWLNKGATHLFILANLPGDYDGGAGDPRRKEIDLRREFLTEKAKKDNVDVEIQDARIVIVTPQKSKK